MIDFIKVYIEKRIHLVKLDFVGIVANVASGLVTFVLLLVFGLFVVLMFNFALALLIGELLESISLGFAVVGLIDIVLIMLYSYVGKGPVENMVKDLIVKSSLDADKNK